MSILAQPATVPLRARPELVDALEACLQHLQEAAHDGDLEGALERLARHHGDSPYDHHPDGRGIPVTLIPAPNRAGTPAPCSPVVVAVVAREANHTTLGPKAVMKALRQHLIRCPNVELLCVVSVVWGTKALFGDSREDLQTHLATCSPRELVGIVAVGGRFTRLQVRGEQLLAEAP